MNIRFYGGHTPGIGFFTPAYYHKSHEPAPRCRYIFLYGWRLMFVGWKGGES
jgi:hypothetical protein